MPTLNLRSSCTINWKISALKQWKERFELHEHTSYLDNSEYCRFSATSRSQGTVRIFKLSWFKPQSEVGVVPLLAQSAGISSYEQDRQTAGTYSGRAQVSLTCLEEQTYSACGFLFSCLTTYLQLPLPFWAVPVSSVPGPHPTHSLTCLFSWCQKLSWHLTFPALCSFPLCSNCLISFQLITLFILNYLSSWRSLLLVKYRVYLRNISL